MQIQQLQECIREHVLWLIDWLILKNCYKLGIQHYIYGTALCSVTGEMVNFQEGYLYRSKGRMDFIGQSDRRKCRAYNKKRPTRTAEQQIYN